MERLRIIMHQNFTIDGLLKETLKFTQTSTSYIGALNAWYLIAESVSKYTFSFIFWWIINNQYLQTLTGEPSSVYLHISTLTHTEKCMRSQISIQGHKEKYEKVRINTCENIFKSRKKINTKGVKKYWCLHTLLLY